MPAPVSATVSITSELRPATVTVTRPPFGVNLIPLESRFQSTCCSRSGSPITAGSSGSIRASSVTVLASAAGSTASIAARTTAGRRTGRACSRSFPVTMRETSRRSSMSWPSVLVLRSMASSARSALAGSRLGERSR